MQVESLSRRAAIGNTKGPPFFAASHSRRFDNQLAPLAVVPQLALVNHPLTAESLHAGAESECIL
jgi:hypothetical protein